MEKLSNKQLSFLRGLAHKSITTVQVGKNGVSEAVVSDMNLKLSEHELVKVKMSCSDQSELKVLVDQIIEKLNASTVQIVGHTIVLYRAHPEEPKIKLPS
jgi:RNA-binding protein